MLIEADVHLQSELVKAIKNPVVWEDLNGILQDEMIIRGRLISIILYTDYTALSGKFTSTFRKYHPFEPLQATKQRHTKFY